MSKRKAATDLTHDNWDHEEAPENAGNFQQASKEVLQKRVIRTAKRRLHSVTSAKAGDGGSKNEPKKLFLGFSGFGSMKTTSNPSAVSEIAKQSFSFLKKPEETEKNDSNEIKKDDEMPDKE